MFLSTLTFSVERACCLCIAHHVHILVPSRSNAHAHERSPPQHHNDTPRDAAAIWLCSHDALVRLWVQLLAAREMLAGPCCYSPAYTQGPAFHCRRFISIRAVRSRHPHISPSCRVFVDTTCSSVPAGTARSDAHTTQQVSSRTPSEHGCDGKGEIRYSSNPVACRAFGHSMHTWPILCAANVQPAAVCYQQALNMSLVCHLNHLLCPHVGTIILPGEGHSANP